MEFFHCNKLIEEYFGGGLDFVLLSRKGFAFNNRLLITMRGLNINMPYFHVIDVRIAN